MKTTHRSLSPLVVALFVSLLMHAAALAALLAGGSTVNPNDVAFSVELVVVSAPIAPADDIAEPNLTASPPPDAAPAPSAETPPPAVVERPQPAAPAPPPEPKIVRQEPPPPTPSPAPKPVARLVAKPAPGPTFDRPITLDPGPAGEDATQMARAPTSLPPASSFAVLYGPVPPYPPQARSRGQEGRVVLNVGVGIDGNPTSVGVAQSSGTAALDQAAVDTVRTWRFRNTSGRAFDVTVPIVFELRASARGR